jgi:hypothetical protein
MIRGISLFNKNELSQKTVSAKNWIKFLVKFHF